MYTRYFSAMYTTRCYIAGCFSAMGLQNISQKVINTAMHTVTINHQ